ncbi:hypothetical protein N7466_005986 [Penicillium verhagenii]|uniref:uncharacterized protein n=1 Tax=Penicillium verhagenii TaxID=1562060 RepID=UPI002544EF42|nr:uncharacterized protein N7466_005986 [Penicillium verhagenii]KAJ5930493.1 hypothetical protein N7466_005986 [Penicillium verhagenii]
MGETAESVDITALVATVQNLSNELTKLQGESEVRKLHHKYGYYLDKCLYKEVSELFADHPDTYVQFLNGRFDGKEGVTRLYIDRFANRFVGGRNGPIDGWLLDHLMAQDIIDYDPAAGRAKARIRAFMSAGTHESLPADFPGGHRQWWEGGLYENEYILQDGVWKILRLRYFPFWHGSVEEGWKGSKNFVPMFKEADVFPASKVGPDALVSGAALWPDTRVIPFHYPHPVTGRQVEEGDMRAPVWREEAGTAAPARRIDDWGF